MVPRSKGSRELGIDFLEETAGNQEGKLHHGAGALEESDSQELQTRPLSCPASPENNGPSRVCVLSD